VGELRESASRTRVRWRRLAGGGQPRSTD